MNDTRLKLNENGGTEARSGFDEDGRPMGVTGRTGARARGGKAPAGGRRLAATAGCALLAAALATGALGCTKAAQVTVAPDGVSVDDGTNAITYVLPATGSRTEARQGAAEAVAETRTVTVSGSDSVVATPDMAELSIGVRVQNEKASEAQREAAETVEAVKKAVVALGVPEEDVSTSSLYLNPRYDWSSSSETIVGYEMSVTLAVKNLPVAQVGAVVTAATAAGANTVGNASYYCSDYDALYRQALTSALSMARGKAEALAKAEGGALGDALSVTEGRDSQFYRNSAAMGSTYDATAEAAAEGDAKGASFDVDPGTVEIEAEVTVQYGVTYAGAAGGAA